MLRSLRRVAKDQGLRYWIGVFCTSAEPGIRPALIDRGLKQPSRSPMGQQFRAILTHARIEEDEFHDLRRTWLIRWLAKGLSEFEVMTLAGHAQFETTRPSYLAVPGDFLEHAPAVSAEAMNGNLVAHLLPAPSGTWKGLDRMCLNLLLLNA